MEFSNEYFEDEVREGFYIPGMIKRSWAEQLSVLKTVDEICARHGIRWFADYGTLIGAVRHRGFIPWDDDMDICMLRDDFERFRTVMDAELPEEYHVLDFNHEEAYDNFLLRITSNNAINYSKKYLSEHNGFPFVAGIDIFPIDYVYPDSDMESNRVERAKALLEQAKKSGDITTRNTLFKKIDAVFAEFNGKDNDGNIIATEVASMYFWVQYANHKYPKRFYDNCIKLPFENTTVNAPAGYMEMMHINYGEWWRINRHGGIHDYPFFTGQEQSMIDAFKGQLPYRYTYSESDLESSFEDKNTYKSEFINNCEQIIGTVNSALGMLEQLMEVGNADSSLEILAGIQELSVNLGNSIESVKGEGFSTVSKIEEFCEQLFELYNDINANEVMSTEGGAAKITQAFSTIEDSFNLDVAGYEDILFLPFDGAYWDSMASVYEEETKIDDNALVRSDVYVIPLDKYIKDFDGTLHDPVNDINKYPKDVMLTNYKDYDFANRHPKRIYIQFPYDRYNGAVSVNPFFYASNLNKRTDELIYIPWFSIDDIDNADGKSMANTQYYIKTPGVIYADHVLVPNDSQRELYIDILTQMAGEVSKDIWEDKITITKDYVNRMLDSIDSENNYANQIDDIGIMDVENKPYESQAEHHTDTKKNLLFFTSVSEFYQRDGQMIDKLKNVLDIFVQNKEKINVLWVLEDDFIRNIEAMCSKEAEDINRLIELFNSENLGIITDTKDEEAINSADAYYGDGGYIMNGCVRKKIPVMVMNPEC